ncbi:hypothetical protein OAH98_03155 [Methylophilaceae bacterium]|nr:hypothetical protein [Methylophilaceae bacterium]
MKRLLLPLFLLSTSAVAEVCNVSIYMPSTEKYKQEVVKKMNEASCKNGDVLNLDIGFADDKAPAAKYMIFETQAMYCNLDKTISFDLSGLNYNLVCSFKSN